MRCRPLILASVIAVSAFSLLAAGCGGGSPRVANIASSTTAATTTTQNGAAAVVAFARCMRSHGVPNLPDPSTSPRAFKTAFNTHSPIFQSALTTCQHLLPNGGQPRRQTITPAERLDYMKAAACMRRHGFPDFPDPTFQNNTVTINVPSSINKNSPQARAAVTTCRKLIPAGLPYSGSNGS